MICAGGGGVGGGLNGRMTEGKAWGEDEETGCVKTHHAITKLKPFTSIVLVCCVFLLLFPGSGCTTGVPQLAPPRLPPPLCAALPAFLPRCLHLSHSFQSLILLFRHILTSTLLPFLPKSSSAIPTPPNPVSPSVWDGLSADTAETAGWCHVAGLLFKGWYQWEENAHSFQPTTQSIGSTAAAFHSFTANAASCSPRHQKLVLSSSTPRRIYEFMCDKN